MGTNAELELNAKTNRYVDLFRPEANAHNRQIAERVLRDTGAMQFGTMARKNPQAAVIGLVTPSLRTTDEIYNVEWHVDSQNGRVSIKFEEGYYYSSDEGMKHSSDSRTTSCSLQDFEKRLDEALRPAGQFSTPQPATLAR